MMEKKRFSRRAGFTLVEVMVVVVILGMLAALATVGTQKYLSNARIKTAQAECKTIQDAIENLVNFNPGLDLSEDEMIERAKEEKYLKGNVGKDPWGELYIVMRDDESGEYIVYSKGENKQPDDEDDVFAEGLRKDRTEDF